MHSWPVYSLLPFFKKSVIKLKTKYFKKTHHCWCDCQSQLSQNQSLPVVQKGGKNPQIGSASIGSSIIDSFVSKLPSNSMKTLHSVGGVRHLVQRVGLSEIIPSILLFVNKIYKIRNIYHKSLLGLQSNNVLEFSTLFWVGT